MLQSGSSPDSVEALVLLSGRPVIVDNVVEVLPGEPEAWLPDGLLVPVARWLAVPVDAVELPPKGSAVEVSDIVPKVLVVTPVAVPWPPWLDESAEPVVPGRESEGEGGLDGEASDPESVPDCPGKTLARLDDCAVSVSGGGEPVVDPALVLDPPV
jgi:hypothetical protein